MPRPAYIGYQDSGNPGLPGTPGPLGGGRKAFVPSRTGRLVQVGHKAAFQFWVKKRRTVTASSSKSQGTGKKNTVQAAMEERRPKATQRLYRSGVAVSSKPPMSWGPRPNPQRPRGEPAAEGFHWTGRNWNSLRPSGRGIL